MTIEAKCWTCTRGYARPDPEGCEYIRSGGQLLPDGAEVKRIFTNNEPRQMIISCPEYIKSDPRIVDNRMGPAKQTPYKKERYEKQKEKRLAERLTKERFCIQCKGKIPPEMTLRAKFCCTECAKTNYYERERKDYDEKPCIICGKLFKPRAKNSVTCGSEECKDANHKRSLSKAWFRGKANAECTERKSPAARGRNEAIEGSRDFPADSEARTLEPLSQHIIEYRI